MTDRQSWLDERRKGIGASEAAAILGLNPHMTPLEVWLSKVHPEMLPEREDADFLEFGLEVEGPILRRYVRETGNQVYKPDPEIVRHEQYPEILCTPDGLSDAPEKIVVEMKFERFSDAFGDPGSDEIPEHFLIQGAHQMACTNRNRVDFALMHGAPPIRIYRAYRDTDLERQLIDRLRGWWSDYVLKQVEPPVDSSDAWKQYLGQKYPKASGELAKVDSEDWVKRLNAIKAYQLAADEFQDKIEILKNEMRQLVGENKGLIFPDGTRVMWTEVKESVVPSYTRKAYRKLEIREASCKKLTAQKSS